MSRRAIPLCFIASVMLACTENQAAPVAPMTSTLPSTPAPIGAAAVSPPPASCLMLHVCDCNLGCASIGVAPPSLQVGARAKVEKGPLAGETVKIIEVTDTSGQKVLALTDLHHDFACETPPVNRSLVGYACESSKAGPVPAKACAKGCD